MKYLLLVFLAIGLSGSTGQATAPILHSSVQLNFPPSAPQSACGTLTCLPGTHLVCSYSLGSCMECHCERN
jgi:hypothetical protein